VIFIVLAVLFLVALFFIKNKTTFFNGGKEVVSNGLNTGTATLAEIINKDTDGDGILDWEEGLWGTDPTKKETTPGISDSDAIEKLKAENRANIKNADGNESIAENLTKTDQFSRELFSTMVSLNQNGVVDQATIDKLGVSLAEKIQNPEIRKVFAISDIKTINDDSIQAFTNYDSTLNKIFEKYPTNYSVLDVLEEFMIDEDTVDVDVLTKLDQIIGQTEKIINELVKMNTPQSLSVLHLNFINSLERLLENTSDIKLFDTDAILALSGISKYEENANKLEIDFNNLINTVSQKLNN